MDNKKWIGIGTAAAILVFLLLCGMGLISTYNGLVQQDIAVKAKWAQVENQLKRRADLIPNLVETVKGYAAQEKSIMTEIAAARAKLAGATSPAEAAKADAALNSSLARLLVIVENYPNLKSDQNFRDLMYELSGTENRIAVARKDYNGSVETYNVTIRSFPTNFLAGMFGFSAAEFFEASEADKALPEVDFGTSAPATTTP